MTLSPRGLNTPRMYHVLRRCRRRRCFMQPSPSQPSAAITSPDSEVSEGYTLTYVCGTNILGRTACEHASAKLVQFDSIPPLVFFSSALHLRLSLAPAPGFFFPVSLSLDLHDPVSPRRTIDPRLTSLGAVSLNSIYGFSRFFSFLLSFPSFFFFTEERVDHRRLRHDYLGYSGLPRMELPQRLPHSYFRYEYFPSNALRRILQCKINEKILLVLYTVLNLIISKHFHCCIF